MQEPTINEIEVYSFLLYTNFTIQFSLIGFILLLVLLGVVFLINNYLTLNFLKFKIVLNKFL